MTAAIMALFFREKITLSTVSSIVLAMAGVLLLYWGDGTGALHLGGVILVLVSALTYALYIIVVDKSPLQMSSFKINFYVLLYCAAGMALFALLSGQPLMLPPTPTAWLWVSWLAIVPAIMALVMMVYAAKYIGSTPTAILGALEPTTAVLIGVLTESVQKFLPRKFDINDLIANVIGITLGWLVILAVRKIIHSRRQKNQQNPSVTV